MENNTQPKTHAVYNNGDHYSCRKCEFVSDNLTEVAKHVVENNKFFVQNSR